MLCVRGLGPEFWTHERLKADAQRPRAANWVRLALILALGILPADGPADDGAVEQD